MAIDINEICARVQAGLATTPELYALCNEVGVLVVQLGEIRRSYQDMMQAYVDTMRAYSEDMDRRITVLEETAPELLAARRVVEASEAHICLSNTDTHIALVEALKAYRERRR